MRKAIKDLELTEDNITWQPCTVHTLQLVVKKEHLEKIQKQFIQPNSNSSSKTSIMQKKIAKYLRHIIADVPLEFQVSTFKANLAEETDQDSKKDSQRLTKVMLINDEWDLLHDLISILGPTTENED
ncbi:hypothetical protein RhiirA1_461344 [Rhizophagus irregularis]|uniref:Uncharacterized protein n=1 Tax=Rhizophagus irregularis TaxID=588596 RepID=A0A2N0RPG4_9GLOM|nr:hypothetical protein RhiirA1_461344 [Rhizophagus irregularis]